MSDALAQQISQFHHLVLNRRFDESTLRILEFEVSVSKDAKSSMEIRSSLREFMRSECPSVIREISEKTVDQKLLVLEFLVRALALIGDVESCLALRYEAFLLRDLKSNSCPWLEVSSMEWLNFAEQSLDHGFYSIARKACENALLCHQRDSVTDTKAEELCVKEHVTERIKKLKDYAMTSASLHSVQAQAAEYLKGKLQERSGSSPSSIERETQLSASTLFRSGIRRRNMQKLHKLQNLLPKN